MIEADKLVGYLRRACVDILERGTIDARRHYPLRLGQQQGYQASIVYLDRTDLTDSEKLEGFYKMTVGLGKTGFYEALIDRVSQYAFADKVDFRVGIVAPKVELLEQIYGEVIKFFPALEDKIGIYGGYWPKTRTPRRETDKAITAITFPSWVTRVDQGEMNDTNIDMLITDEGHRGTSEAREKRLLENFAHAARYAFMATPHFDEQRTVVNTHKREIFSKGLVESVRDGESAAYIRAQHHVIRVAPPKSGEPFDPVRAKQLAFINLVKGLSLTGVDETGKVVGYDEITGDRFTDNQMGVYTGDTLHADKCADDLNAIPELKKIAKGFKAKAFAVSVHTNGIDHGRQQTLKDAYETGKRRTLCGDELFKEGYDYPPMKVVIVYQTGSVVDLEQIIGRAVRQFWNEDKNRYEGATAISTTIYIGVDPLDPNDADEVEKAHKVDEKARKRALAASVSAVDILGGSAQVLGPGLKPAIQKKSGGGTRPPFPAGMTVRSYTSIEEVKTIHAEREQIREELRREEKDNLTPEKLIEWIKATKDHTGKYITGETEVIFCQKEGGDFEVVEGENGNIITLALRNKLRGLVNEDGSAIATSLWDFRRKHGLGELGEFDNLKLTPELLVEWIQSTKDHTGKYPTQNTEVLYRRKGDGVFEAIVGDTGSSVNAALGSASRGLKNEDGSPIAISIWDFRRKYGLGEPGEFDNLKLTPELLVELIDATKDHDNGKYPTVNTEVIWRRKKGGGFEIVEGENGNTINMAFRSKGRGLINENGSEVATSLWDFRKRYGLGKPGEFDERKLTKEDLIEWIEATKEHTGKSLSNATKVVWRRKEGGGFEVVKDETGALLEWALANKKYGLISEDGSPIATSLSDFKKKFGIGKTLSVEKLIEYVEATKEQTGKYLTQETKVVWRRKEDGGFEIVKGENGSKISGALREGHRGLVNKDGSLIAISVWDFRKKYGLVDMQENTSNGDAIRSFRETLSPANDDTDGNLSHPTHPQKHARKNLKKQLNS